MFRRFSLKTKLAGAFIISAILVATVGLFSIKTIDDAHAELGYLTYNGIPFLNNLHAMRAETLHVKAQADAYEQALITNSKPDEAKAKLAATIEKLKDAQSVGAQLAASGTGPESQNLAATATPIDIKTKAVSAAVLNLIAQHEQKAPARTVTAANTELAQAIDALDTILGDAAEQTFTTITKEYGFADALTRKIYVAASSVVAGAGALVIGFVLAFSIARNVRKIKEGSGHLATGDFSKHITVNSKDELGDLARTFNQMSDNLRDSYRRLALEKERDETLLANMSDGVIALDEQGNIALTNHVAAILLELNDSHSLAANTSFTKTVALHKDNKPLPPEEYPNAISLRTGRVASDVFMFETKAKHKIEINIASSPFKLEGRVAGAILVLRDVTKEKAVDRMKTEFISLASHQLRTPLSAIKWFSEMLLSGDAGKLKPEQEEFAKNVADSTERMIQLVNSLLNISRIESGRIVVAPQPTDLSELVGGIINDLKAKTEQKKQTLVVSVHANMPKINIDPRLIGQVYLNLLTNAIKYTQKGGEISVFISKKDDQVISQVTDNGYGIPKEQQGRLFQKFFRASNAVEVETDGTGLGLYLIKAIVESSGGKIWFESAEGKGTTFWFSIPASGMKAKEGEVTLDA